jgi:hypothetical protein
MNPMKHIFIFNIHNNTNDAMILLYLDIILWEIWYPRI